MKDLIEYIAKSLVDHPEEVIVTESKGNRPRIELSVAKEDMGKLIGRQGATINSIRNIVKCFGYGIKSQINIKINEPK